MVKLSVVAFAGVSAVFTQVANASDVPPLTARELVFSVENMDTSIDPRMDFAGYAAGTWMKTAIRPERLSRIGAFDYMGAHVNAQMKNSMAKAAAEARTAPKGSPVQQVGDFYAAYMDQDRINSLGMTPLQPELARIVAISSLKDFSAYVGRFELIAGENLFLGFGPGTDRVDNSKVVLFAIPGTLGMPLPDIYTSADGDPRREAYRTYIRDCLKLAGYAPDRAAAMANTVLTIETSLFAGKLTPVEASDPRNTYNPVSFAEFQAKLPELDVTEALASLAISQPETLVLTHPRYPEAVSRVLRDHSLSEIKDFAAWALIRRFLSVLPPAFEEPGRAINLAILGITELPPRDETALQVMQVAMGHPVSKVYVDDNFSETTRTSAREMIGRIKDEFLVRIRSSSWLSSPTRSEAITKLEKLSYAVGYPENWIDYAKVEIKRDDALGNLMRLIIFSNERDMSDLGKPPHRDEFSIPNATLPMVINAGYLPGINGFEVTAGILQPPVFESQRDAPVYYCRLGQIIGHEMTHGFDSQGRLFDANGNLRNWWTPVDDAAFQREAMKLIDQANDFEILPGLKLNGQQTVTENMADVGGLTLAYEALKKYLADNPEKNVMIDGLTPEQRCFIAFAQMWTVKETEQSIRQTVATDGHPPNQYRVTAALRHIDGFYEAFGIKESDPMWLAPSKRLKAW